MPGVPLNSNTNPKHALVRMCVVIALLVIVGVLAGALNYFRG